MPAPALAPPLLFVLELILEATFLEATLQNIRIRDRERPSASDIIANDVYPTSQKSASIFQKFLRQNYFRATAPVIKCLCDDVLVAMLPFLVLRLIVVM